MSEKDSCIKILERIYSDSTGKFSFGENEFTISDLIETDESYDVTYSCFPNPSREYSFDSLEEVYKGLYDIYKHFNKVGVPRRILRGLESY